MRIAAPGTDSHGVDSRRTLLRVLQPSPGRPCRGCVQPCPCSGSPICDCNCSRACPYAPAELSSDPTRHPIESKIVSLVYELNTFNGIEPCWSCEGHVGPAGTISRIPQVWFYVSDRLSPMSWRVSYTTFASASDSAFGGSSLSATLGRRRWRMRVDQIHGTYRRRLASKECSRMPPFWLADSRTPSTSTLVQTLVLESPRKG